MSAKETFSLIVQKVKETFDFLRESFAETPLEPDRQSKNFSVPEVDSLEAKQPPSAEPVLQKMQPEIGFITKPLSSAKRIANKTPASTSIQFSDIHLTYLQSLVDACSFVIFPGLGKEGRLLQVPLEQAYVPITLMDKRIGIIRPERDDGPYGAASALSLSSALQRYRRLLVQGGPGSGKTTLSQILVLSYAKSLINVHAPKISSSSSPETKIASQIGKSRLLTVEKGYLPVFVSLQELGQYLLKKVEKLEEEDCGCLRAFLHEIPAGSNCAIYPLPEAFFEEYLSTGEAIVIFDGLDELADPKLRQRVIHLIRKFIQQYPTCRYVVSSRLFELDERFLSAEQFGTLELGEFTPLQMRKYLSTIKSFVESGLPGDGTSDVQLQVRHSTEKLIDLIDANPFLADLATSPLLLNMLMLVKRDRDQIPLTRADLFESGIQILFEHRLAKSLAGKKAEERKRDQAEARQALEMIAFWLHQNNQTRFNPQQLMPILERWFLPRRSGDEVQASASAQTLLSFLLLSSGLLVPERSEFVFSQRTFQEFLAAHALADREDTLAFTLNYLSSTWWRNVIFFESSILNKKSKHRVGELVQFILDSGSQVESDSSQTVFLAYECLSQVDSRFWETPMVEDFKKKFRRLVNSPVQKGDHQGLLNKIAASLALAGLPGGQVLGRYWTAPVGEPEWVTIPAGAFWMGEANGENSNIHQVLLPEYQIARVPVTNAQYAIYLNETGFEAPEHWWGGRIPKLKENHPVVNVNWHEALAYCSWMTEKIKRTVCLPSEAEWEKAARGSNDQREYPWGEWVDLSANTSELGFGDTTPVGLFPSGSSPFGLLDMTGNVREWTRSLADFGYPYDPGDRNRENLQATDDQARVLRGGSFYYTHDFSRCANRQRYYPDFRFYNFGFRLAISPLSSM